MAEIIAFDDAVKQSRDRGLSCYLGLRVTKAEKDALRECALKNDTKMSVVLRTLIQGQFHV